MKVIIMLLSQIRYKPYYAALGFMAGVAAVACGTGLITTSAVLIAKSAFVKDVLDLMVLIVAVRFFGIFRAVFRYAERYLSHDNTFGILSRFRKAFFMAFNRNYANIGNLLRTSDIYTRMINDIEKLQEFYLRGVTPFITAGVTGLGAFIFLCFINKTAAVIYIIFYIFCMILIPYASGSLYIKNKSRVLKLKEELNSNLMDTIYGASETSIYGLSEKLKQEFYNTEEGYERAGYRSSLSSERGEAVLNISQNFLILILFVTVIPLVIDRSINVFMFALVPMVVMGSFEALGSLILIYPRFIETKKAGERIEEIIGYGETEIKKNINNKSKSRYDLNIENLSVVRGEKVILDNLSLNIKEGAKIAITGKSGSGKTTLINVLIAMTSFEKGNIKIGEISYSDIDEYGIREYYSVADQNPMFINGTIRENMKLADIDASDKQIFDMLEICLMRDYVDKLPGGLDFVLVEGGSNLSEGQRQRLSCARALLRNSKIVILDEPFAGLDAENEKELIKRIDKALKKRTLILITHRLTNLECFDNVISIENGRINQ